MVLLDVNYLLDLRSGKSRGMAAEVSALNDWLQLAMAFDFFITSFPEYILGVMKFISKSGEGFKSGNRLSLNILSAGLASVNDFVFMRPAQTVTSNCFSGASEVRVFIIFEP